MPLKHAILGLLNYADMTGYDIDRYFKSSIAFFWYAQTSQIYKELNTLMKHHWVDSEIVYQSDKPNKKVFHITEEGKVELHHCSCLTVIKSPKAMTYATKAMGRA